MKTIFSTIVLIIVGIIIYGSKVNELEGLTCKSIFANFEEEEEWVSEARQSFDNHTKGRVYCKDLILENCNNEALVAFEICYPIPKTNETGPNFSKEVSESREKLCREETTKFLEQYKNKEEAAKIFSNTSKCVFEITKTQACTALIESRERSSVNEKLSLFENREGPKNSCTPFEEFILFGRVIVSFFK